MRSTGPDPIKPQEPSSSVLELSLDGFVLSKEPPLLSLVEVPKGLVLVEKASSPDTPEPKVRIGSVFTYVGLLGTHKKSLGYTGQELLGLLLILLPFYKSRE